MERRRLDVVLGLVALIVVVLAWLAWRTAVARAELAALGVQLPWLVEATIGLGHRLLTPLGALVTGLVLAGGAAGPLVLGRPRRITPLVVGVLVVLSPFVLGVHLVTWCPRPEHVVGVGRCANAIFDPVQMPGMLLLGTLLYASGAAALVWVKVGWDELGRPRGTPAEEGGRVLFASAPCVLAVHALLGGVLERATPVALGLPAGSSDAGAFTATGVVVLAVAVVRAIQSAPAGAVG